MRSRSIGPIAIVVLLVAAGTVWWHVAPGTGGGFKGNLVRYEPFCAKLAPIAGATASPSRGSPYYMGEAKYRDDNSVTVFFEGADAWRAHRVEFERRLGSRWVPIKWATLNFDQIVVDRIRDVAKRHRDFAEISWRAAPLKALSFPVAGFEPGRWRACFAAATEVGGRPRNVFANFTVTDD